MRYGLRRRLGHGVRLRIFLTFVCTLDCLYCGNKLGEKTKPKMPSMKRWNQWASYVDSFPVKVNEIFLSGGEPVLIGGFNKLVNHLTKKYLVTIFSNLHNPEVWDSINKTDRIRIQATYHKSDDKVRFLNAYERISKKHRVDVDEIGIQELSFSKLKTCLTEFSHSKDIEPDTFSIAPDGNIFTTCYNALYYSK